MPEFSLHTAILAVALGSIILTAALAFLARLPERFPGIVLLAWSAALTSLRHVAEFAEPLFGHDVATLLGSILNLGSAALTAMAAQAIAGRATHGAAIGALMAIAAGWTAYAAVTLRNEVALAVPVAILTGAATLWLGAAFLHRARQALAVGFRLIGWICVAHGGLKLVSPLLALDQGAAFASFVVAGILYFAFAVVLIVTAQRAQMIEADTARRRAEDSERALREAQHRMDLVFDNTSDLMSLLRVERDGRMVIESINRSMREYLAQVFPAVRGLAIVGGDLHELMTGPAGMSEEDAEMASAPYREAFERKVEVRALQRMNTSAGEILREAVVTPVLDSEGRCTHVFYRARDVTDERRRERERRQLAARIEIATAATGIGVWEWDFARNGMIADDHTAAVYGVPPGTARARIADWLEHVHPDDRVAIAAKVEAARAARTVFEAEFRILRADGEIRYTVARGTPVTDPESGRESMIGTTWDATERKLKERELHRARAMVELSRDGVLRLAPDGRILDVNRAACAHLGYLRSELLELRVSDLDPNCPQAEWLRAWDELLLRGEWRFETELRRRDGSHIPMDMSVSLVTHEGEQFATAVMRDVTARKLADAALRDSEARWRFVIHNAPVNISVLDADGHFVFVNRTLPGASLEKLLGHSVFDFVPRDFHPQLTEAMHAALNTGEPVQFEMQSAADGILVWYACSIGAIRADDGRVQFLLIATDDTERQRAAVELRANQERLAKIVAVSPVAIVLSTLDEGRHIDVNPAFSAMTGYTREQVVARTPEELQFFVDLAPGQRAARMKELAETGTAPPLDLRYRRVDGGIGWINLHSYVIELGGARAILTFLQDITERKTRELELRRLAERLAAIYATSPVGILVTTIDKGSIVEANDAVVAMTGYTRAELIGHTLDERGVWSNEGERGGRLARRLARGRVMHRASTFMRRDGEQREVEVSSTLIELAGELHVLNMIEDVTERRRHVAALRQSEERFKRMFEISPHPTAITTLEDGKFVEVNAAFLRFWGFTAEETYGRSGADLNMWVDAGTRQELTRRVAAGRGGEGMECRIRKRSGEIALCLVAGGDFTLGAVRYMVSIAHDIGELKRTSAEIVRLNTSLEEMVRARTAQLEAANRELESFSYSVSHDLRAPLRHITGFASLLMERPVVQADAEAERLSGVVVRAAARMGMLIDDLLAFSRVSRREMTTQDLRLCDLTREVAAELMGSETGRAVDWRIGELPVVRGDRQLLRLVLQNLLENALKYTRPREQAIIEVGAEVRGDEVIAFVRDNGVGFDMQYAGKLFGVFQRLHSADEFEGTGVGLANVQRIIERHGGRVWAEAAPNRGATFWFTLPLAEENGVAA